MDQVPRKNERHSYVHATLFTWVNIRQLWKAVSHGSIADKIMDNCDIYVSGTVLLSS